MNNGTPTLQSRLTGLVTPSFLSLPNGGFVFATDGVQSRPDETSQAGIILNLVTPDGVVSRVVRTGDLPLVNATLPAGANGGDGLRGASLVVQDGGLLLAAQYFLKRDSQGDRGLDQATVIHRFDRHLNLLESVELEKYVVTSLGADINGPPSKILSHVIQAHWHPLFMQPLGLGRFAVLYNRKELATDPEPNNPFPDTDLQVVLRLYELSGVN